MSGDRELFSDRMLEGEYTTWNWLWTRDLGAPSTVLGLCVDNYGTVHATREVLAGTWIITRENVITYTVNYSSFNQLTVNKAQAWSVTGKYVLYWKVSVPYQIVVYRYGVNIWNVAYNVPPADLGPIRAIVMSANGKYVAAIHEGIISGSRQYVILREGV